MNNQTTMRFRVVSGDVDTVSPNANVEADMILELDLGSGVEEVDLKAVLQDLLTRVGDLESAE